MPATLEPPSDNPKDALQRYIAELWGEYLAWYNRASTRNFRLWLVFQSATVLAGFATAILAALINVAWFEKSIVLRILLVVLPVLGSATSTVMIQTRLRELMTLREVGLISMQSLVSQAEARFAAAETPEDHTVIHQWLVGEVEGIERSQARAWATLFGRVQEAERNAPTV